MAKMEKKGYWMRSINRISMTDQAVQQIKSEILSGKYKIGDRLETEKDLCTELGIGRSTVREALRMLKALGFIEIRQGKGAFVIKISEDSDEKIRDWFSKNKIELIDFIEVRMSLEPLAVRLVIERASDEQISNMNKILELFENATDSSNALDLALLDEAFHTAIAEASGNNLLIMLNQTIAEFFREYRVRSFAVKKNIKNALEPHRQIMKAITERNAEEASQAMLDHLKCSMIDINRAIE
jgi:GntR family transcriptional repressor for pyruvate dehydrogenase complex